MNIEITKWWFVEIKDGNAKIIYQKKFCLE
jgi:hypothetical protein